MTPAQARAGSGARAGLGRRMRLWLLAGGLACLVPSGDTVALSPRWGLPVEAKCCIFHDGSAFVRQARVTSYLRQDWPERMEGTVLLHQELRTTIGLDSGRIAHAIHVTIRYRELGLRDYGAAADDQGRALRVLRDRQGWVDCQAACAPPSREEVFRLRVPAVALRDVGQAEYCVNVRPARGEALRWCIDGHSLAEHLKQVAGETRYHGITPLLRDIRPTRP